jgi:hypothetical protein
MFERERDPVIDDTPLNVNEASTESEPPMVPCTLERHASEPDEAPEDNEQEEENNQAVPDNQTLLRLLEEHEKVSVLYIINIYLILILYCNYLFFSICF